MKKRMVCFFCLIIFFVLVLAFVLVFFSGEDDFDVDFVNGELLDDVNNEVLDKDVNFQKYNYDFVDEDVKNKLNSILGPNGKIAFYLPPTGYINVSRGEKYGVAYALNNPNPSGENRFVFNWTVDESVVDSCGVSLVEGQSWIERGWTSWGKIGEGWIDHMTVYFSFPSDIEPCTVKYNFKIRKDLAPYASKQIVFNLL